MDGLERVQDHPAHQGLLWPHWLAAVSRLFSLLGWWEVDVSQTLGKVIEG